jgi:hypothetical protein
MSVLTYFLNDENKNNDNENLFSEIITSNGNIDKELSSSQRAKKKYMKKYQQTEKYKEIHKEHYKKHYNENSKKIYESQRKRLMENPEMYEKFKEQQRQYHRRRREKKDENNEI